MQWGATGPRLSCWTTSIVLINLLQSLSISSHYLIFDLASKILLIGTLFHGNISLVLVIILVLLVWLYVARLQRLLFHLQIRWNINLGRLDHHLLQVTNLATGVRIFCDSRRIAVHKVHGSSWHFTISIESRHFFKLLLLLNLLYLSLRIWIYKPFSFKEILFSMPYLRLLLNLKLLVHHHKRLLYLRRLCAQHRHTYPVRDWEMSVSILNLVIELLLCIQLLLLTLLKLIESLFHHGH